MLNYGQRYIFLGAIFFSLSCTETPLKSNSEEDSEIPLSQNEINLPEINEEKDTLELRLIAMGLIDVQEVNPEIHVDLKYASEDNFMKTNVYGKLTKAYLQKDVAEKLSKAQNTLRERDSTLNLLIYDAVRPQWVQWKMWNLLDSIPVYRRVKFVSNPKNGSVHNYGAAVDLTLCDKEGNALDMGAGFDDPSEIAYPSKEQYYLRNGQLSELQIKNRQLLREVMRLAGFTNLETEWWHFNAMSRDAAKRKYQIVP